MGKSGKISIYMYLKEITHNYTQYSYTRFLQFLQVTTTCNI